MIQRALVLFFVLAVASCAAPTAPPPAAAWTGGPITDETTFRQEIVGQTLTLATETVLATVLVSGDGTMRATTTTPDGQRVFNRLEGTWTFADGRFCRTLTVVEGSSTAPAETCISVVKRGDRVTLTDERGPQIWTVGAS